MTKKSYTHGQIVIIRDAEWTIRKVEILADDGYELTYDGFSNFIKGKEAIFLATYESNIQIVYPKETKFIIDKSNAFKYLIKSKARSCNRIIRGFFTRVLKWAI